MQCIFLWPILLWFSSMAIQKSIKNCRFVDLSGRKKPNNPRRPDFGSNTRILSTAVEVCDVDEAQSIFFLHQTLAALSQLFPTGFPIPWFDQLVFLLPTLFVGKVALIDMKSYTCNDPQERTTDYSIRGTDLIFLPFEFSAWKKVIYTPISINGQAKYQNAYLDHILSWILKIFTPKM